MYIISDRYGFTEFQLKFSYAGRVKIGDLRTLIKALLQIYNLKILLQRYNLLPIYLQTSGKT